MDEHQMEEETNCGEKMERYGLKKSSNALGLFRNRNNSLRFR